MKRPVKPLVGLALVLVMGTVSCVGLLFPTVDLNDLPETRYEVTRYISSTKSLAIILDDPDDGVLLTFSTGEFQTKKVGLNPPQKYLEQFMGSPKAYELQDKETGDVLGYLLISSHLEWLVNYDRDGGKVTVSIEDAHTGGGNGGA
jgi:hypothetical protein